MTATFRGAQGLSKLKAFIKESTVIKIREVEQERKLQLDVYGSFSLIDVDAKVIEITKAKQ